MGALEKLPNPIRIVCTKCVRIAKVVHQERDSWSDGLLIATVCCQRRYGYIDGCTIQAHRYKPEHDFTTDHIESLDLEQFEKDSEERRAKAEKRRDLARWAAGKIEAP